MSRDLFGDNSGVCVSEFKIHFIPWKQMSTRAPKLGNANRNVFSGGAISCKEPCHVSHGFTPNLPGYLERKSAVPGPESPRDGVSLGSGPEGPERPR